MWRWCRTPFAHCAKRTPTFALRCSRGRSSSLSSRGWTSIFWKPTTQAATRGCSGCCVWPARRGGGESTPWPTCTGCCVRASSACCSGCTECRRRASIRGVSRSGSGWGVRIRPPRRSNIPSCVIATCCAVWASSSTIRSLRRSRYGRIRSGRKKECGSASHPFRRRRARPTPKIWQPDWSPD